MLTISSIGNFTDAFSMAGEWNMWYLYTHSLPLILKMNSTHPFNPYVCMGVPGGSKKSRNVLTISRKCFYSGLWEDLLFFSKSK